MKVLTRVIAPVPIIFSLPCGEQKRQNPGRVKCWATTLAILAVLSASLARAEDFKTIKGKVYKDATINRVEADGIVLRTKMGISKVYFIELPKDVQERFHPIPAKSVAAQREREPVKLEAKQNERRQADQGGRVVVVGQSARSWKVIVAGINFDLSVRTLHGNESKSIYHERD